MATVTASPLPSQLVYRRTLRASLVFTASKTALELAEDDVFKLEIRTKIAAAISSKLAPGTVARRLQSVSVTADDVEIVEIKQTPLGALQVDFAITVTAPGADVSNSLQMALERASQDGTMSSTLRNSTVLAAFITSGVVTTDIRTDVSAVARPSASPSAPPAPVTALTIGLLGAVGALLVVGVLLFGYAAAQHRTRSARGTERLMEVGGGLTEEQERMKSGAASRGRNTIRQSDPAVSAAGGPMSRARADELVTSMTSGPEARARASPAPRQRSQLH